MNNTEKKLDALIDALGLDVDITKDYQAIKLTKNQAAHHFEPKTFGYQGDRELLTHLGEQGYVIDADGMYLERLVTPIINYKLTKRNTRPVDIAVAKLVVSWWENEPWVILPEKTTFTSRPDFVIKAYEVLNEEI